MKKVLLIVAVFVFGIYEMNGQNWLFVSDSDPKGSLYPLMSDQTYSTVISVSGTKVDLMNTMKSFLIDNGYGDQEELPAVKIDETMNEFHFPIICMEGQSVEKGLMGLKLIAPPVVLKSEVVFTFDENDPDHVTMTITNYDGMAMCAVDDDHNIGLRKKSISKDKGLGQYEPNEYDKKIDDEAANLLTMNSKFVEWRVKGQEGGKEAWNSALQKLREERKNQFDMYMDAIQHGSLEIIAKENLGGYGNAGYTGKNEKMWNDIKEHYISENWVVGMSKGRWENGFQPYYDELFRNSAATMGGTIESVSLNGETLYEQFEGKVLPVNPKERKKWIKKGLSY